MRLVPRQLRRYGMTGDVPYYGGRFTPAQTYAISHPQQPMPTTSVPSAAPVPVAVPAPDPDAALGALQELLDSGVITREEHEVLRTRMGL
jgi:hypothetical protein